MTDPTTPAPPQPETPDPAWWEAAEKAVLDLPVEEEHINNTLASRCIYDAHAPLRVRLATAEAERDQLAKFKAYVHKRLDDAGVPVDPESSHKAEGCRIGGRLDYLIGERDEHAAEEAGCAHLIDRQARLLTGVVNAVKGAPPPNVLWSHHDAVEIVAATVKERDALREHLKTLATRVRGLSPELYHPYVTEQYGIGWYACLSRAAALIEQPQAAQPQKQR